MTNWKKAGLTALAGSLVASSAFAGAVTVTGSANLTYTANSGQEDAGEDRELARQVGAAAVLDRSRPPVFNAAERAIDGALWPGGLHQSPVRRTGEEDSGLDDR